MRKLKCILCIITVFFWFTADAQQQTQTKPGVNANAGQQATPKSPADAQQADTTGTANVTQGAGTTQDTTNAVSDARASNTPAVQQFTSSGSGSPAVLSGDKGKDRDGTNNVQRASMNMAGSPAANLNLDDQKAVDVDSELRDRQDYAQEKQTSAQHQSEGNASQGSSGESSEINEKSRRENNALSDQNVSSKDKKKQDVKPDKPNEKKQTGSEKNSSRTKEKG
jgi:hypothetical protein